MSWKLFWQICILIIVAILLLGVAWFTGNLIEYNKHWDGLSPALRDEWENTGEKEENPIAVFIKRGLGMGLPQGLDQLREPGVTIANLQDAVRDLQTNQRVLEAEAEALKKGMEEQDSNSSRMRAEIDGIKSEMEKRDKAARMAEAAANPDVPKP